MLVEVCEESLDQPFGLLAERGAPHPEGNSGIRQEQCRPGASLMVCKVPVALSTLVNSLVLHVARRKGADASCCNELTLNDIHNASGNVVRNRRGSHRQCEQLVRTDIHILSVIVHIVGQIAAGLIPECLLVVLLDEIPYRCPGGDELAAALAVELLILQGEAEGVIPERIGLHLVAGPFRNRMAVGVCVHPGKGDIVLLCPEQSVRLEGNFLPDSRTIALDNALYDLSVFLPYILGGGTAGDVFP